MDTSSEVLWTGVGAIATVVTAFAAVAGLITIYLALRQLRFNAWLRAQEIWTKEDFVKARGLIFSRLDGQMNEEWTDAERKEGLEVCRRMDEFARLAPYLTQKKMLQVWSVPFAEAWFVLQPVVKKERDKCRWQNKWDAFERVGRAALDNHPEVRDRAN